MLCEAQQNFARSTQVLEKKIEDKSVFLDIIKQVQLPLVKVQVRTVEEMEKIEGKTYRELTLMCHLPNFKRINPNTKEQTRTMAAYIYFVLYEQITGITDRLHHRFQMSDDTIQEVGKREETARRTRQVERGERRIWQKPGRSRQNGRRSPCQENKERKQIRSSNNNHTQR